MSNKERFFPRLRAKMKTNKQDIEILLIITLKLLGSQDSRISEFLKIAAETLKMYHMKSSCSVFRLQRLRLF